MTVEQWLGKDNRLGIDIWHRKYQKNDETFDEWLDRVSLGDYLVKQLIIKKKFIPGGRILSNVGIEDEKSGMSNCYSRGFIEDDYNDIMQAAVDIGKTFKAQGGQGLSLSKLRPKGTPIGDNYVSDGIVPFMKIYNEVTQGTSQGGARKGALLMSLDAWHKEAMNFITIKSQDGLIEKANLSLEIDDEFMECVDKYYQTGEVITVTRHENYSGHEVEWEVTPIEVFKAFIHNNYDWGDPGCLFVNRFRNYNMMEYCDEYQVETCNPSLRAGTLVLTNNGPVPVEKLEGKIFNTTNINGEVVKAKCFLSGKDKQLYKVTLENGESIYCTPEHKWPVLYKNSYKKKTTEELKSGDRFFINQNNILSNGTIGSYEDGMFFGYWYGDGSATEVEDGVFQYSFTFGYGDKIDFWLPFIKNYLLRITGKEFKGSLRNRGQKDWVEIATRDKAVRTLFDNFGIKSKKELPGKLLTEFSENFRRGFIDGLLSADGSVDTARKGEKIVFTTANENIAKQINSLFYWYGLKSQIIKCDRLLNFGSGEKEYIRYDVILSKGKFKRFSELFKLSSISKQNKIISVIQTLKRENIKNKTLLIKNIELTNIFEDVWDIHVFDDTHTFSLNYCITGNCGEQPLNKHGACNLASINLSEFVNDPYTDHPSFDWSSFDQAVKQGIIYLDKIIDLNAPNHALPQQRENSLNFRNCGLGVFGYATMLMKMGMEYGSVEAIEFTDGLFHRMFREAVKTSNELAKELGSFPKYNANLWNSKIINNHFTNSEIEKMKPHGLRNCSLLSIAPTGTLSSLLNESGGCEPEFAISYTRRTVGLTDNQDHYYTVYCKAAREYKELYPDSELPDYFVSSSDIDPQSRVVTQAVMQDHVDTAISSTVNLPESCTEDEMAQIYLQAWKNGLKGLTIFRSNCKRLAILTTDSHKDKTEAPQPQTETFTGLGRGDIVECSNDLVGKKRKLTTGCGSLHVLAFFDPVTGDMQEVYLNKGSTGGCANFMTGLSRTLSLLCRAGVDVRTIKDQLDSTGTCPSYATRAATKHDTSKGSCCPMAVGNALVEMWKEMQDDIGEDWEDQPIQISNPEPNQPVTNLTALCPECGEPLVFEGGCNSCKSCGYSKCN